MSVYKYLSGSTIDDRIRELESRVPSRTAFGSGEFRSTGYLKKDLLEESVVFEGSEDELMEKYIRKLMRRGGFTKDSARKYLERILSRAKEEGR